MKDFLAKLNWITILGVVVAIEMQIGNGTMSLTNMVPDSWIPFVKAWAANLGSIGALIMSAGAFGRPAASQVQITPSVPTIVKVLLCAFALSFLLAGVPAMAQGATAKSTITRPRLPLDPLGLNDQTIAGTTAAPAKAGDAALACTFQMLIHLTPENLLPTINSCVAGKLVADTQRALDSATKFGTSGKGDADALNCLTPALAIFQAGVQVPAVPAVTAADGTVTTPAVPAQDPGPILLFQKYREFTLSGALTSCQSWFNGPINATVAAGIAGAGAAVAGAALLAPVK